uniref:HA n=2 Tax=root TaxID=1 RepID=A0A3G1PW32_9ORTO|nr:HA [Photinus pyralis orthomyxo-like virus 2]
MNPLLALYVLIGIAALPKTSWMISPIAHQCDYKKCLGSHYVKETREPVSPIEVTRATAIVDSYPDEVEIGMIKRQRYTSYCYDGTSMDPNTGCKQSTVTMLPSISTAREWVYDGLCKTGKECPPDGDCTGSDAKICLTVDETVPIGPQELKWVGTRYMVFPKHSCVTSWACDNIRTKVETFIGIKDTKPTLMYTTKEGEQIAITKELYSRGTKTMDGYTHYLLDSPVQPKAELMNVSCFSASKDKTFCSLDDYDEVHDATFHIDDTFTGYFRNLRIRVQGSVLTVDKGKIASISPAPTQTATHSQSILLELQKSASIESITEAVSSMMVIQLQNLYNDHVLATKVHKIGSILSKVVAELSKINPESLGEVIGRNVATNWLNPKVFELCPCHKMPYTKTSNCYNGYVYKSGVYTKVRNWTECKNIDEANLKPFSLVDNQTMLDKIIYPLPPRTAASDSNAWIELQRIRLENLNPHYDTPGGSSSPSVFGSFADPKETIVSYLKSIFLFGSAIAFWTTFLLSRTRRT